MQRRRIDRRSISRGYNSFSPIDGERTRRAQNNRRRRTRVERTATRHMHTDTQQKKREYEKNLEEKREKASHLSPLSKLASALRWGEEPEARTNLSESHRQLDTKRATCDRPRLEEKPRMDYLDIRFGFIGPTSGSEFNRNVQNNRHFVGKEENDGGIKGHRYDVFDIYKWIQFFFCV